LFAQARLRKYFQQQPYRLTLFAGAASSVLLVENYLEGLLTANFAYADKSLELKTLTPNLNVRWQAEDWRKEHLTYIQPAAAALNGSTALSMHGSSSSRPHSAGAGTTAAGSSGLVAPVGHTNNCLTRSQRR
jgi:hypothetical protein